MVPLNPYIAGNPVGDSPAFVGRVDVLREVLRVLRRPQDNAIVLYGQRRFSPRGGVPDTGRTGSG